MKIAILVSGFVPNILGGTEIATYYIAKHLAQRGHDVHVITQREKGMPKKSIMTLLHIRTGMEKNIAHTLRPVEVKHTK